MKKTDKTIHPALFSPNDAQLSPPRTQEELSEELEAAHQEIEALHRENVIMAKANHHYQTERRVLQGKIDRLNRENEALQVQKIKQEARILSMINQQAT